jgi:hypothetical protein
VKFGDHVLAFKSETTTHAALGVKLLRETGKSETHKKEKTMIEENLNQATKNERNFKPVAMILAALVLVAVVEVQAC